MELVSLIDDFMTDGMAYSEDEALKLCETIIQILIEKKLIMIESRKDIGSLPEAYLNAMQTFTALTLCCFAQLGHETLLARAPRTITCLKSLQ